jgi:hypothetical protein
MYLGVSESKALSDRCAPRTRPGSACLINESTGQRASHRSRGLHSADLFLNGKVFSWPLRPCGGSGPTAFPLVSVLVVGATGFEPVTSSVSGIPEGFG